MKQKINKSLQTYSNRNRLLKSNGYEDYATYLLSDHWKHVKANIPEIMKYCHCCGSRKKLELHHRSYNSMLDTKKVYKNIMYVCDICHDEIHAIQREKNISIEKAGNIIKSKKGFPLDRKSERLERKVAARLGKVKNFTENITEEKCKTCGGKMRRKTTKKENVRTNNKKQKFSTHNLKISWYNTK